MFSMLSGLSFGCKPTRREAPQQYKVKEYGAEENAEHGDYSPPLSSCKRFSAPCARSQAKSAQHKREGVADPVDDWACHDWKKKFDEASMTSMAFTSEE